MAERQRQWWLGLAPEDRVAWMMECMRGIDDVRYGALRQRHPGASEAELDALRVAETYRDTVEPGSLARAVEAIRKRGRHDA
ncbi:MAG: hypothetical protein Kow0010_14290 [Dehalococcoidia bacterium]